MSVRWSIEFSEEVRIWYEGLTPTGKASTDRVLERLALRGNVNRRITYVFDPDRRVVTLTTFRKQRQNERTEVLRARRAQAAHEASRHAEEKNGRRS